MLSTGGLVCDGSIDLSIACIHWNL